MAEDDDAEQTRWWWTCSFKGCSQGGYGTSPADRDDNKASHEQFCDKNPANK